MMGRRSTWREWVVVALYLALFFISLGGVSLGLVMLKVAFDLRHPMEFFAVFFAASLVTLIGASLALGFGLRAAKRLSTKVKNTP